MLVKHNGAGRGKWLAFCEEVTVSEAGVYKQFFQYTAVKPTAVIVEQSDNKFLSGATSIFLFVDSSSSKISMKDRPNFKYVLDTFHTIGLSLYTESNTDKNIFCMIWLEELY